MKIGILTQPLHTNYGGIIQNWALQQVLIRMGHEPEMIWRNYDAPDVSAGLFLSRCGSCVKTIIRRYVLNNKKAVIRSPFEKNYNPWMPRFADDDFINRIARTKECFSDLQLRKIISGKSYDAFIVGSDQVWREEYSPRIETYFLDFLPSSDSRPKIAYAASFGTDTGYISPQKIPGCQKLLERFSAVSVREDGGLQIIHEVFRRTDAIKALDPSLLLDRDDYETLIRKKDRRHDRERFIGAYILDSNDEKENILADIASEKGLEVKRESGSYEGHEMSTISQWLAVYADAEYIVTDSFHGCVFSIIFNKPFVAIGNKKRGLDRFTSLLSMLKLEDRLILTLSGYYKKKTLLMTSIDYGAVDKQLQALKKGSINFLKNGLSVDSCHRSHLF